MLQAINIWPEFAARSSKFTVCLQSIYGLSTTNGGWTLPRRKWVPDVKERVNVRVFALPSHKSLSSVRVWIRQFARCPFRMKQNVQDCRANETKLHENSWTTNLEHPCSKYKVCYVTSLLKQVLCVYSVTGELHWPFVCPVHLFRDLSTPMFRHSVWSVKRSAQLQ